MGYTHYFEHEKVSQDVWNRIVADCKKVFEGLPDVSTLTETAGGYGITSPLKVCNYTDEEEKDFTRLSDPEIIRFNGVGETGHETFLLYRDGSAGFAFCKTAQKPYDLFVCCCLIIYWYHSPHTIDLSSDGDMDDWKPAIELVSEILGNEYGAKFIMEEVIS